MFLETVDPKFSYRPAESGHPDVGVRFDRDNAAESFTGRGLDSRPTLKTARRRKTTVSLSGLRPLEPTHRLFDPANIHETVAVALSPALSEFKLETLTTGDGGLGLAESRIRYQKLLEKRDLTAGATPSVDLQPEITW